MTKNKADNISKFVSEVMRALEGRDSVTIAELTENLEADLRERQEEEGDAFQLGDSKVFAAELLQGAGLSGGINTASRLQRFVSEILWNIWSAISAIRPAWWVFRGLMAYSAIWFILLKQSKSVPGSPVEWLAFLGLMFASVQIGRANLKQWWARLPLAALNVLALLVGMFWVNDIVNVRNDYSRLKSFSESNLLIYQGQPVTFAFAYDKNGVPLPMTSLKTAGGNLMFAQPTEDALSPALEALKGKSLTEANWALAKMNVTASETLYESVPAEPKDRVLRVQKVSDGNGGWVVVLIVAN